MTLQPDDPRLTAYALGELDAAEASAVEADLAADPAAAAAVEEIRKLAGELRTELAAEAAPGLTDRQREAVTASAGESSTTSARADRRGRGLVFRFWVPLATAAAAVIAVGVVLPIFSERQRTKLASDSNVVALEGRSNTRGEDGRPTRVTGEDLAGVRHWRAKVGKGSKDDTYVTRAVGQPVADSKDRTFYGLAGDKPCHHGCIGISGGGIGSTC